MSAGVCCRSNTLNKTVFRQANPPPPPPPPPRRRSLSQYPTKPPSPLNKPNKSIIDCSHNNNGIDTPLPTTNKQVIPTEGQTHNPDWTTSHRFESSIIHHHQQHCHRPTSLGINIETNNKVQDNLHQHHKQQW